jgi:DNA-binding protein WhiA
MRYELAAYIAALGTLSLSGRNGLNVSISTESPALARRIFLFERSLTGVSPQIATVETERLGGKRLCRLSVYGDDAKKLMLLMHMMEPDPETGEIALKRTSPKLSMKRSCDKRAYLRAAFIGCGSVVSPEKDYHLEFVCASEETELTVFRLLERVGYLPKRMVRKERFVVYLKGGDAVASLLAFLGASAAVMKMENVRVQKTVHNRVNRAMNCDSANLRRQTESAGEQVKAIEAFKNEKGLAALPQSLRELAEARLKNPSENLSQLGQALNPPISKSAANHRMRRLMELIG